MARLFTDRLRPYAAPPPPWQRELRDWLRRRAQVVVLPQAQTQQAAMAPASVRKFAARTIAALARELAAIEKTMKALIHQHATPALRSSKGGALPAAAGTREARQGGPRGVHAEVARDHQCQATRRAASRNPGTGLNGKVQDSC